jgi:hypothetical protein
LVAATPRCVSSWLLYQAIRLGELPVIRWGRRVVIDREDLAAFIATKRDGGVLQQRSESSTVPRAAGRHRATAVR